jgi:hypothetical protein
MNASAKIVGAITYWRIKGAVAPRTLPNRLVVLRLACPTDEGVISTAAYIFANNLE